MLKMTKCNKTVTSFPIENYAALATLDGYWHYILLTMENYSHMCITEKVIWKHSILE